MWGSGVRDIGLVSTASGRSCKPKTLKSSQPPKNLSTARKRRRPLKPSMLRECSINTASYTSTESRQPSPTAETNIRNRYMRMIMPFSRSFMEHLLTSSPCRPQPHNQPLSNSSPVQRMKPQPVLFRSTIRHGHHHQSCWYLMSSMDAGMQKRAA